MRIAVTGARGWVGRAVSDLARQQGHEVVEIDRVEAAAGHPVHTLDLADYADTVAAFEGCDALIHLAAISGPGHHPDHIVHDNNVVASYHALRAAVDAGIKRICQASSINAIGGRFSRKPLYDYFPVDERHPTYAEDPYSLSKWICEQQADSVARRFDVTIASLRLHGVVEHRDDTVPWLETPDVIERQLWGYTSRAAAARAFILGVTASFEGHEVCYIVAPDTMVDTPSEELHRRFYPDVPLRQPLGGSAGFFDCQRAFEVLGWTHDDTTSSPYPTTADR